MLTKTDLILTAMIYVIKGTSKKVFEMLGHRLHVVHAPQRWYSLEQEDQGVNQVRVIAGVCDCCLKTGMQFYDGPATTAQY